MIHKHYLTEDQYNIIWTSWINESQSNYSSACKEDIQHRIYLWNTLFKNKFNLSYTEPLLLNDSGEPSITDEMRNQPDFWGTISGSEKNINWFLLQL